MKRLFTKRFSMAEIIGLLAVAVLSVTVIGYAATTLPHTFSSGETVSSGQVNANFQSLANTIDGLTSCRGNSPNDIMVKVGPLCVDKYEASVWLDANGTVTQYGAASDNYPFTFPDTGNWTTPVYAVSKAGVLPSTRVTWFQAQQACALSGKRLLTNAEWQMAAAGTPTAYEPGADNGATDCNTSTAGAVANTGGRSSCVSNWNVNDMVGNVWEWVADWMQGSTSPWAPSTPSGRAGASYGADFMYGTNPAAYQGIGSTNFPAALIRGGGWSYGTSAGVFALLAANGPAGVDSDIGFRCAR